MDIHICGMKKFFEMIKVLPHFITRTDQVYNDFGLQQNGGRGQGYQIPPEEDTCPGDENCMDGTLDYVSTHHAHTGNAVLEIVSWNACDISLYGGHIFRVRAQLVLDLHRRGRSRVDVL